MLKKASLMLALCAILGTAGCGGAESDAAKAFKALVGESGSLRGALREARTRAELARGEARRMANEYRVSRMLKMNSSRMSASARDIDFSSGSATGGTGTVADPYTFEVTFSGDEVSCSDETYTFDDGTLSFAFGIDVGASETTMGISIGVDSKFKGGDFSDFVTVDCDLDFEITFDNSGAATSGEFDIGSCGGFSCKIDGESIACEDMEDSFNDESCS